MDALKTTVLTVYMQIFMIETVMAELNVMEDMVDIINPKTETAAFIGKENKRA